MTEKVMYQRFLNNLIDIKNNLHNSINYLEAILPEISYAININGNSYKKREIETILSNLKRQYSNLQNVYIPEARKKYMEEK